MKLSVHHANWIPLILADLAQPLLFHTDGPVRQDVNVVIFERLVTELAHQQTVALIRGGIGDGTLQLQILLLSLCDQSLAIDKAEQHTHTHGKYASCQTADG